MLSGEKILITGASGMVGMALAASLAKTNEVVGVSRYLAAADREGAINAWAVGRSEVEAIGVKPVAADLLGDLGHLDTDFTYVIHLAHTRLPLERLQEAIAVNAVGAGRIMHHCRRAKAALIMSSTAVYSPPADIWTTLREDGAMGGAAPPPFQNATSPVSKISLEAIAQYCATEFGLRTVIMRPGIIYGPNGGTPTRDLKRVMDGETIPVLGDPWPCSPIHVDDMADQIEALMDAATAPANIVNWGGDEVVTQRQWCDLAAELAGKPYTANHFPGAPGNICDPAKRAAITGPCKVSFRDGFSRIYDQILSGESTIQRQLDLNRNSRGAATPG